MSPQTPTYTRPVFAGIGLNIDWSCPTRVKRYHPYERWWFWFTWGVRRPGRPSPDGRGWMSCPSNGAFLFNPYIHLRVLGLFIGAAISVANWVRLDKTGNVILEEVTPTPESP